MNVDFYSSVVDVTRNSSRFHWRVAWSSLVVTGGESHSPPGREAGRVSNEASPPTVAPTAPSSSLSGHISALSS